MVLCHRLRLSLRVKQRCTLPHEAATCQRFLSRYLCDSQPVVSAQYRESCSRVRGYAAACDLGHCIQCSGAAGLQHPTRYLPMIPCDTVPSNVLTRACKALRERAAPSGLFRDVLRTFCSTTLKSIFFASWPPNSVLRAM